jgi:hypothetical protein
LIRNKGLITYRHAELVSAPHLLTALHGSPARGILKQVEDDLCLYNKKAKTLPKGKVFAFLLNLKETKLYIV